MTVSNFHLVNRLINPQCIDMEMISKRNFPALSYLSFHLVFIGGLRTVFVL